MRRALQPRSPQTMVPSWQGGERRKLAARACAACAWDACVPALLAMPALLCHPARPSIQPLPPPHTQLFYALSCTILVLLLLAAWLALVLKKDDSTQGGWLAK